MHSCESELWPYEMPGTKLRHDTCGQTCTYMYVPCFFVYRLKLRLGTIIQKKYVLVTWLTVMYVIVHCEVNRW